MVLLGGVQTLTGPLVGAALFTWLQDTVARQTDYWRALLGATILALVLVFPLGIAGCAAGALVASGGGPDMTRASLAVRGISPSRSAACTRSTTSASTSAPASCWR